MKLNEENLKVILGLKLKSYRQDSKLSLKEFSQKSGLSPSYINEIEKGKKYPKADKLVALAEALNISYDELISTKLTKELNPLYNVLESPLMQEIPFDMFGFKATDLMELMSNAPAKFSAFLSTLIEIARNYDVSTEQFFFAALRSYQEMHNNFFPELEDKVKEFKKSYFCTEINTQTLALILQKEFGIQTDFETLGKNPHLSVFRSVYIPDHSLLINPNLLESQQTFNLAKEIAFQFLKLKVRPTTSSWLKANSFEHVFNNFQASYFAGALLIDKSDIEKKLSQLFNLKKWNEEKFIEILTSYNVTPETFLTRLTQIIPQKFGIDQLFFLRFFNKKGTERYKITKELHFSRLHSPHGIGLDEHYCNRWITISLFNELHNRQKKGINTPVAGIQRSTFYNTENEYFCISLARSLSLLSDTNSCVTIGFVMTDQFKKTVKFASQQGLSEKIVNETCERCALADCEDRLAEPRIEQEIQLKKDRNDALDELIRNYP